MTFPVGWLHQWMGKPMYAGSLFHIGMDTLDVSKYHLGVRAHIFSEGEQHVALVIWVPTSEHCSNLESFTSQDCGHITATTNRRAG